MSAQSNVDAEFTPADSYPFKCAVCGHGQRAKPSISMKMGENHGHGSCVKCGEFLHLSIAPDLRGEVMVSERWDDFVRRETAPEDLPRLRSSATPPAAGRE